MKRILSSSRILVVGCAGSGKSTFSKALGRAANLPLIHLDQLYWQPGWVKTEKQVFVSKIASAIESDAWIVDGNYKSTLPLRLTRAEVVVFLDLSRTKCIWNVILRTLKSHGTVRSDMPDGCPERFDWEFIKYIWNFPHDYRPVLIDLLQQYDGEVIRLTSLSKARKFLTKFDM